MAFVPEIESESDTGRLKRLRAINEERGVLDVVLLAQFGKKRPSKYRVSRRYELCVEQFVRFWIDSRVQPIALIAELNHRFVDRNVIRALACFRL
jgi:hypothetical protein